MRNSQRPRVAAIALDDLQVESIAFLCGELRRAHSPAHYVQRFNWTETDAVVSGALTEGTVDVSVSLLTVGPVAFRWSDIGGYAGNGAAFLHSAHTRPNTERELTVPEACPGMYKTLAAELSRQLARAPDPPLAIATSRGRGIPLIQTTSGIPVALRLVLPARPKAAGGEAPSPIALLLPSPIDLPAWFRAFLSDLHESDPVRVPQAPPRLSRPADWYTPMETTLADRVATIEVERERLDGEREQLKTELAAEGEKADRGIRRVLWADGDDLVAASRDILARLGFTVRDMDAALEQGEPKREDLRLTLQGIPGWEAIVEVKGYTGGTRTNDARQIRQHRERFIKEEGRTPDLTVWLSNPSRTMEPSSRPAPDSNVTENAQSIGAVYVLTSDLYKQWALVAAGKLEATAVVRSLTGAEPGLWSPRAPHAEA